MKPHARWIAVLLAILSLSACFIWKYRPVSVDLAVVKTRWIGMTTPGSQGCPVPSRESGWTGGPLFSMEGLDKDLEASAHQAGLDQFCVYDYKGSASNLELPREVSAGLRKAVNDKVGMTSSSVPTPDRLATMIWAPFYERFSYSVQIPKTLPGNTGSPRIRLAVLDTQPDGVGVPGTPGNSKHGYTLLHMAGDMACKPSAPCGVGIASRLVMPVVSFDTAQGKEEIDPNGGFRGTFADLTKGLWEEIKQRPRPGHLVLNLSLGWDGEKIGGWEKDPAKMTPEVQAVYRVLEVAASRNILVIAAAGNELSGPNPTERPLLPAGWESRARSGKNEPFVYAVSGIDGRGHPLVSTRTYGEASRVAYADHVVVPDPSDPMGHTATLTGTSVAAAVVSTTAALVWSYHPGLKPAEVMDLLARSGDDLHRKADFAFPAGSAPRPVRRISLCQALKEVCTQVGASCQGPVVCKPSPPSASLESELCSFQPQERMSGMSGESLVASLSTQDLPNLLDQPWVGPQPGVDPCPNCAVTGPPDRARMVLPAGTEGVALAAFRLGVRLKSQHGEPGYHLRIEIPSDWAAGDLLGATLEVFDFDSHGRKRLHTGCSLSTSFGSGSTLEVTNPCFGGGGDTQARLSFVLAPPPGSPSKAPSLVVDSPLFVEDSRRSAGSDLDKYSPAVQNRRHTPPERREGQRPGE